MDLLTDITSFYSHLVCSKSGKRYAKNHLHTFSDLNGPLLARYRFEYPLNRKILKNRPLTMWRYREMLPVESDEHIVSLGEGMTPLIPLAMPGQPHKTRGLFLKDESLNPTGSFKARGLAMAISKAKELGVRKCVIPTAGNAGGAMSAYCAKAGLQAVVYMPAQTPEIFKKECEFFGAKVILVEGNISDCARRIAEEREPDWFDVSTLKEPFRLEGKKTMGYEIVEQLQWNVPDVIIYPTGGGTGLIGIWKAMEEMEQLGWIGEKRPRMVAVQTVGCYPIVKAFHEGRSSAEFFADAQPTVANGLLVPAAFGDELILKILRKSGGTAVTVKEQDIITGVRSFAKKQGLLLAPEGAAVWSAYQKLLGEGWLHEHDTVVLLNTGSLYKYMENF